MRIEDFITHHYHSSVISYQTVLDTQIDDGLFQVGSISGLSVATEGKAKFV